MKRFKIERSRITPEISYDPKTKTLEIEGRSYPENTEEFYEPLFNWIEGLSQRTFGILKISIKLDYLNTSSTKVIINALYKMEQICKIQNNQIMVNWYYKREDEDILETGEVLSKILSVPIKLVELVA